MIEMKLDDLHTAKFFLTAKNPLLNDHEIYVEDIDLETKSMKLIMINNLKMTKLAYETLKIDPMDKGEQIIEKIRKYAQMVVVKYHDRERSIKPVADKHSNEVIEKFLFQLENNITGMTFPYEYHLDELDEQEFRETKKMVQKKLGLYWIVSAINRTISIRREK